MGMMLGLYTAPPSSGGTLLLDATPYLTALTCSTDERGFESLSGSLDRALSEVFRYYSQGVLYAALVKDGTIVWEGRLEDPSLHAGDHGSGLGTQALGAWRALTDDRYIALWSTSSVANFVVTTGTMIATYSETGRWQLDTNSRLMIELVKGTTYTLNKAAGLLYSVPHGSTRGIVGMQFSIDQNLPAAMTWRAVTFGGDVSTVLTGGVVQANAVGTAALVNRAYHLTFATQTTAGLDLLCNAGVAYAAETGASYVRITNLRLVSSTTNRVNTTLTANRAAGAGVTATVGSTAGMYAGMQFVINSGNNPSEMITVTSVTNTTQFVATFVGAYVIGNAVQGFAIYADEVAGDIITQISTLNSAQLSSSTALIQSPGLDLTDEIYEDAVPADVLAHLVALGDNQTPPRQWETGVYEGRALFFRPQGSAAKAWYVDVTDLSITRTLEDLSNSVYATYKDARGRTLRTANATDSASITRYGLTRRSNIAADTTSSTQAGVQVSAQLADHADPKPRASIHFEAIYDAYGARYPLWLVRAGDTITIRNIPPSLSSSIDRVRTFRVTHTNYNVFADVLDVEPEAPQPTLEVMLARRAEGINR